MKQYAIYLRKSRADLEAESRGEGETLARHRTALRALAERRGLNVTHEYSELVTGDSIAARPQMQLLLDDVKMGMYAGVIVNDVDRLGRGDSIDQEIIKYAFIAGNCIIITPSRDINPAAPSDEDMLDFNMFFARFEYRKIKQRLTQGRIRSAASGNFISPRVPYGYRKVVNGKSITLEPDPNTSGIVKMIFDWYASGEIGYKAIAEKLNNMGIKTYRGYPFNRETVRKMLVNPVYIGTISWGKTSTISAIEDGHRLKKHIKSDPALVENAHPAIVPRETFEKVQRMFSEYRHAYPTNTNKHLVNPLAGLVYCSQCGRALQIRGNRRGKMNDRFVSCVNIGCTTRGTYVHTILNAVLDVMGEWCIEYKDPEPEQEPAQDTQRSQAIKHQISTIEAQLAKAQELVELGVYTPSEYMQRRSDLQGRLQAAKDSLYVKPTISLPSAMHAAIPAIQRVLDAFPHAQTPEDQNALLKSVIARIEYTKTAVASKSVAPESLMKLVVYPRIDPR